MIAYIDKTCYSTVSVPDGSLAVEGFAMAGVPKELREYRRSVIAARYESEGSVPIARDLGVTRGAVLTMAKRMGLVYHDRYRHHGAKVKATAANPDSGYRRRSLQSKSCDIHYFDTWTPNAAYILGFFYADASIEAAGYHVVTEVTRTDEAVLRFIKRELRSTSSIKRYTRSNRYGTKPSSYLRVYGRILIERLQELGLRHRKTFLDEPFPSVPDELVGHFVRGFFDGDGSISCDRSAHLRFVGTPRFLTGMIDRLAELARMAKRPLCETVKGKEATWTHVVWCHRDDLCAFYKFVYPESGFDFCLERKRAKLAEWLARPYNPKRIPPRYRRGNEVTQPMKG